MRVDLFKDLWLERRHRFAFGCLLVAGWFGAAALLYPLLADAAWVNRLAGWFNPLLESRQAYWLLVMLVFGLPVIGGVFALWEGGTLFKGPAVRHSIAFLLAYPLPRWQVYLSRLAYLLSACFLLTVVGFLSGSGAILLTGSQPPVGYWKFLPGLFFLIVLFGEVGILTGVLSQSFWFDRLAGIFLLILLYLPYGLNASDSAVHYSPLFYVLGELPLSGSIEVGNLLGPGLLGVVGGLLGGVAFERLELE